MGIKGSKSRSSEVSFEIKPRARRDGFTLSSKRLVYPLWYPTLHGAISYARFLGRHEECHIHIFNSEGSLVDSKHIHRDEPAPVLGG